MKNSVLFWIIASFLSGSIPYSLLFVKLVMKRDIRQFGDGNPGAINASKAGNWLSGLVCVLLDAFKGAVPVALAYFGAGISYPGIVLIALAPILGHAFSPFLKGRGGKAISVTFGIWAGLTLGEVPIILGLLVLIGYAILDNGGWAIILGMTGLVIDLILNHPSSFLLIVWVGNMLILLWTHRIDLHKAPHLRPWIVSFTQKISHLF